jgi:PAS domain S-box-containing protein
MAEPPPGSAPRPPGLDGPIFELIFATSPFAILIADDAGRYLEANAMACQLFGQSREQLLGKTVYDFVEAAELAPTRALWDQFRHERIQTGQFRLVRPDGSRRVLQYQAVADFAPGLHLSFLEDVTDRQYQQVLLETVLRQMPAALVVAEAPSGKLILTNEKFAQVLRHPELPAASIAEYSAYRGFHPDGRPYQPTDWPMGRALMNGEVVTDQQTEYLFGDGQRGTISTNAAPIRDGSGEVIGAVAIFRDVTPERQARLALESSEARLRTLADALPLVIWIGDHTGRSQYYNRHWFAYTGLPWEAEGSPALDRWADVIHPDDQTAVAPLLRDARARGDAIEITFRMRRHDGIYRWHLARSVPIRDEQGEVTRRLGSATDIEDQRRAIEDLQRERELRERFVAALTHDLRSPLAAVKMAAQILLRKSGQPEPSAVERHASRIIRNVDHADRLLEDLLDASRISAGQPLAVTLAPCDMAALVRDVLTDLSAVHGDRFELDLPAEVNGRCDRPALRRTLENLVSNAIKYGDQRAPVRVAVREDRGEIRLSVHNRGNPIPPDEQPRIFQPYHRVHRPDGQAAPGWGLGLTLVRGTAEAHGGTVRVDSSAEAGTTFTVTLRKNGPGHLE